MWLPVPPATLPNIAVPVSVSGSILLPCSVHIIITNVFQTSATVIIETPPMVTDIKATAEIAAYDPSAWPLLVQRQSTGKHMGDNAEVCHISLPSLALPLCVLGSGGGGHLI